MSFKGKERTDNHSIRFYDKKFNELTKWYPKIRSLSAALDEAENEIERLNNKLKSNK